MYQKEIIYMGLHKDGSRLGSAGFLKVESRDQDSSLYLKVKNIPHSINGRFPVRFYNGTVWKEVDGITLQEGSGLWEEKEPDFLRQVRLQIILPSGYLIEGISREAQQKMDGHREYGDIAEKGTAPRREKQGIPAVVSGYGKGPGGRTISVWNVLYGAAYAVLRRARGRIPCDGNEAFALDIGDRSVGACNRNYDYYAADFILLSVRGRKGKLAVSEQYR